MKIRPVGAELFHANEQTHRRTDGQTRIIVAFDNFANAPKNQRDWREEGSFSVKRFLFVKTCHETFEHKTDEVTRLTAHT